MTSGLQSTPVNMYGLICFRTIIAQMAIWKGNLRFILQMVNWLFILLMYALYLCTGCVEHNFQQGFIFINAE